MRWIFGVAALVCAGLTEVGAQLTETPITASPGAWLIDATLVTLSENRGAAGVTARHLTAGYVQVAWGVASMLDLQLAVQSYERSEIGSAGEHDHRHETMAAAGDVCVRAKWQGWAADEGGASIALLPYLTWALERNEAGHRHRAWGLVVPAGVDVGTSWRIEAQVQVESGNDPGAARRWAWLAGLNAQRTWGEQWGGYVEVLADFHAGRWHRAAVFGGVGVTRTLPFDVGLDLAYYRRVRGDAPDWLGELRMGWEL